MNFTGIDYTKHNYKYRDDVISDISNRKEIGLYCSENDGNKTFLINGKPSLILSERQVKQFKRHIKKYGEPKTVAEFNKLLVNIIGEENITNNVPSGRNMGVIPSIWNKIDKLQYSHYENKGTKFEYKMYKNSEFYVEQLKSCGKINKKFKLTSAEYTGRKKVKRNLSVNTKNEYITLNGNTADIGHIIADVIYHGTINGKPHRYNISAKYGRTHSFANVQLSDDIFNMSDFYRSKVKKLSAELKTLLNFFNIDPKKFIKTFLKYDPSLPPKKNQPYDETDITKTIKKNKYFWNFIFQTIGYNYILYEQPADETKNPICIDIKSEEDIITKVLGGKKLLSAKVSIPSAKTNYKLVKVNFEFPNINITYIFRNSSGKIIPDKIFAEYKFKNHD
jgi:hypothetical protein